jgi:UDP-N-acetylmuramate--alanine ligase
MNFGQIKNFHFIGIGGIGMSGLARILLEWGYQVSGSDLQTNEQTAYLEGKGAKIFLGHKAEHIPEETGAVIYSSAVKKGNPEYKAAAERNISLVKRSVLLGLICQDWKNTLAVCGTHGKTTTSAMLVNILKSAGKNPGYFLGGLIHPDNSNAARGDSGYLVIEADEYDHSFLDIRPQFVIVNNIELDHTDIYFDAESLYKSFVAFLESIPFYGAAFLNMDDAGCRKILPRLKIPIISFGRDPQANYLLEETELSSEGSKAFLRLPNGDKTEFFLQVPGMHNLMNATAAFSLAHYLGIQIEHIKSGLADFITVDRRFQKLGEARGILFIDDYAHHPTELAATLSAARAHYPERRLVAVLQPHTYTRTRDFFTDFARALCQADLAFVLDVYPAREKPIENVSSKLISDAARHYSAIPVFDLHNKEQIPEKLSQKLQSGDIVIFIGAGDISQIAKKTVEYYGKL